jgi:energy-coupling factor transporter ATP-binding protein EcfA2
MKVEIRNLGVVKQAEIDLKPLTVFIGPNNAGKTWVAYALAGILGEYGWQQYMRAYMDDEVQQTYPPLDAAVQQVLDEGNAQIDMVRFADEYIEAHFNDVARFASDWMREFMGTEWASFDDLEVCVRLEDKKADLLASIQGSSIQAKLSVSPRSGEALLNILKEQDKPTLYFYTTAEGSVLERLPERAMREYLAENVLEILHRILFVRVYPFPTERTTFITFPISLLDSSMEAIATVEMPRQERTSRSLAAPISLFFHSMVDAFNSSQSRRNEQANKVSAIQTYVQLVQLLERKILGGSVDFSTPEPEPGRELFFQPTGGVKLVIPAVSSMVKELAPLVLYLRYLAEPGELIVIDEPEMNLHPKAQVQLTELLAMLVNAGLRVLITTHSPYIVDHLVNLLKAAETEDKEAIREKFYLKRTEAFISRDQVSAYLFEDGTAKDILDQEGFIDWGTFSNVSEQISQLYFEI